VHESGGFLRDDPKTSLEVVEFCIFDEETLGHFKREFDGLRK
jgi:hypothetical protein